MMRRRGGPGILGTMARTAVIAGTATAVSNKVSAGAAAKAQAQQQHQQQQQAAAQTAASNQQDLEALKAQMEAMQAQQVTAATQGGTDDLLARLQQLAQLKEAGMLTDEEFAAAKAKVLAS